ncbi:hypothetical protein FRC19_011770 [Serendipita sp. 401]|nr:hypothetical protein FRC19_011770 [Serendipita sp. 401]
MDDDSQEVVDWGDDDEYPQGHTESTNGGQDADALSLASDDDDDDRDDNEVSEEKTKDPHQKSPNESSSLDGSQKVSIELPSQPPVSSKDGPKSKPPQDNHIDISTKDDRLKPNPHGLPPKPMSPVYTVSIANVSVSATAMAPRMNGNHRNNEDRESTRHMLPSGWEERKSRKNETYYCNIYTSETQWEPPTKPASKTRAESREGKGKRDDHDLAPARRRSRTRSRERRISRRSVSPAPQSSYRPRPRSRSFERIDSYRPTRDRSPRGDAARPIREPNTRRRSISRERPGSPRPYHRGEEPRARSPPYGRDERDSRREHRPVEPLQSSRHRSPPPPPLRTRSRERDERRPREDERPQMDVDRFESLSIQGTLRLVDSNPLDRPNLTRLSRRQRSWDSGSGDQKRRRLVEPPPAGRGTDRYVPDHSRSSRMDIDPPEHTNQDKKRPSDLKERREDERPRYEQRRTSPPPKEGGRHTVGKSGPKSDISPQKPSPPQSRIEANSQSAARFREPLPSQADAMRMGTGRSRPAPMDLDQAGGRLESVSTKPKAERPRVPRSSSADRHETSSQVNRSAEDRRDARTQGDSYRPRDRQDPSQNSKPDSRSVATPANRSHPAYSNNSSNLIPISNPRTFGQTNSYRLDEKTNNADSTQASNTSALDEDLKNKQDVYKRTRPSRFGPPPVSPSTTNQAQIGVSSGPQSQESMQLLSPDQDRNDAPPAEGTPKARNGEHEETQDFQGSNNASRSPVADRQDAHAQLRSPETDLQPHRTDGVRIDKTRVSRFGPPPTDPGREITNEASHLPVDSPSEVSPTSPNNGRFSTDADDALYKTMGSGLPERPQVSGREDSLLSRLAPSNSREYGETEYGDSNPGPSRRRRSGGGNRRGRRR